MSRRKRQREKLPPMRLPAIGSQAVSQLANGAGWPVNKASAFIVRAGWNALNSGSDEIPAMRLVMANAIVHHETKVAMQKRLALTGRKLRDSQKALGNKTGGAR